jgi:hypothetical protein
MQKLMRAFKSPNNKTSGVSAEVSTQNNIPCFAPSSQ